MKTFKEFIFEKFIINQNSKIKPINLYEFISKYDLELLSSGFEKGCYWKKYKTENKKLIDQLNNFFSNKQKSNTKVYQETELYNELNNNPQLCSTPIKTLCDSILSGSISGALNIIALYRKSNIRIASLEIDFDNNDIYFYVFNDQENKSKYEDLLCQICEYIIKLNEIQ